MANPRAIIPQLISSGGVVGSSGVMVAVGFSVSMIVMNVSVSSIA